MSAARATLLEDGGAAAAEPGQFFRCPEFLEAEGTTHTLLIEAGGGASSAVPLIVREIEGTGGLRDATSPYSYPGGKVAGEPIDPAAVDFSEAGLVSVFIRDRLGEPGALAGPTDRSLVMVSDPALERKSRMSDRQQIRKNETAGYTQEHCDGPASTPEQRAELLAVYTETMRVVDASDRYFFDAAYFDLLLTSPRTSLHICRGPEGDCAAAAIGVISDGFLHYYLSGTADEHRRRAPSKNLIVAFTDHAEELGLPMNLGGGVKPGDGLEEFKRGFANTELPFRTHELICDEGVYAELSAGRTDDGFFPLYRQPV